MKKTIITLVLLMPLVISAEEVAKLKVNPKSAKCEKFDASNLNDLNQNDLESVYCGYKLGINLIEVSQVKEFEKYPDNTEMKLSIQKTNTDKIMKCILNKADAEDLLNKMQPPYTPQCEKYSGFPDLSK